MRGSIYNSDNYADSYRGGPHDSSWTEDEINDMEQCHEPGCQCKDCMLTARIELALIDAGELRHVSQRQAEKFTRNFLNSIDPEIEGSGVWDGNGFISDADPGL